MMNGYIAVRRSCAACGEQLWHHKADDLPAYLVIAIVGKLLVTALVTVEFMWSPPAWIYWAVWPALTLLLTLLLLPRIKGAVIGLQWALGMHGFGDDDPDADDPNAKTPGSGQSGGTRP